MKIEITLDTDKGPEVVEERAIRYLEAAGYKSGRNDGLLMFKRGSLFGTLTSMSPKRWKVSVLVQTPPATNADTKVIFNYRINTTGQSITQGEVDFWNAEIAGLQQIVATDGPIYSDSGVAARSAVKGNWKEIGLSLLGALVVSVLLIILRPLIEFFAFGLGRWMLDLVPVLGKTGVAILATVSIAGIFVLFASMSKLADLLSKLRERYLRNAPKLVVVALALIIYMPLFGVILGCGLGIAGAALIVQPSAVWYWFAGLAVFVVVEYVVSLKRKKSISETPDNSVHEGENQ